MELPELSLAPSNTQNSSHESKIFLPMKRKCLSDQTSVDLQHNDSLPLDWEQCLDLESGKMYYLNRKTLRKTWDWPKKDQKLNLELNISSCNEQKCPSYKKQEEDSSRKKLSTSNSSSGSSSNMVALACLNCHLLVILSKSSPSCPNCKYVHSLPTIQQPATPTKVSNTIKSLNTLSLLN